MVKPSRRPIMDESSDILNLKESQDDPLIAIIKPLPKK